MGLKCTDQTELTIGAIADGQALKRTASAIVGYDLSAGSGDMTKAVYDPDTDGVIAIAQGGTGATTAPNARTALGLGTAATHAHTDYDAAGAAASAQAASQPLDGDLTAIAALVSAADRVPYATGAGAWALATFTAAARSLVAAVDAAAQRVVLGLGTAAVAASTDFEPAFVFKGALAGDVSTGANTTPVNVTGLVFTFVANAKYIVEVFGIGQSAAATTGWGIQLDTSVAVTTVGMTFYHQLANTGTLSGGSSIADDASVGVSSGIPTAATNCPFYASGILIAAGNGGTAQLRWRSEVAAVSTVKAGTLMRVQKVA